MEGHMYLVCAIVLIVSTIAIILRRTKSSSSTSSTIWPAGPKTLPFIGNLHQLRGDAFHIVLTKLSKLHGGVMTIWVGSWRPVIVISDIDKAWEVLVTKSSDYSARDDKFPRIVRTTLSEWQFINSLDSSPLWHQLRKGLQNGPLGPFNISAQTSFQEGEMEQIIRDIQEEATQKGGIVKPLDHLKRATLRLLSRLIFGQTFNDDSFIESVHYAVDEMIRIITCLSLLEAFSYAKYLPRYKHAVKELHQLKVRIEDMLRPLIASTDPPENSYLHFLQSLCYTEELIGACIFELFTLGVDSTASTTTWALAFLIHNQLVQEKLYQDIKRQAGVVKVSDLSNMEYLQAVMKETMRMKPIAPLAIPHKAEKDTTLMGRKVAKGTVVLVNLYALHHDANMWEDPHRFMPERFLQEKNDRIAKAMEKSFLPFSAGMRICAGMEIGKLQVSLGLANLVNAFKWTSVVDGKLPDMSEELLFITLMKTPLEARIVPRIS